jgi:hypothetical protein
MRSTFKVLFYLKKNKLNKDGEAPVMARITPILLPPFFRTANKHFG